MAHIRHYLQESCKSLTFQTNQQILSDHSETFFSDSHVPYKILAGPDNSWRIHVRILEQCLKMLETLQEISGKYEKLQGCFSVLDQFFIILKVL